MHHNFTNGEPRTITSQTANREGYYDEFLEFWSARPEVKKVWFSLFTPQIGADNEEILQPKVREKILAELITLREKYPKLVLPDNVVEGYKNPPKSPDECIFAKTTLNLTADLKSKVTPCQFGGNPDCSNCGCIASAGLAAVGEYRLFNFLPLRKIFDVSEWIGKTFKNSTNPKERTYQEVAETNTKIAKLVKRVSQFRQF